MSGTRAEWERAFPVVVEDFICRRCGSPARVASRRENWEWACARCKFRTRSVAVYFKPVPAKVEILRLTEGADYAAVVEGTSEQVAGVITRLGEALSKGGR